MGFEITFAVEYHAVTDKIYVDPSIDAAVIKVGGLGNKKVGSVPVAPNVPSVEGTFSDCAGCAGYNPQPTTCGGYTALFSGLSSGSYTCRVRLLNHVFH
jgi:hypothetical protein